MRSLSPRFRPSLNIWALIFPCILLNGFLPGTAHPQNPADAFQNRRPNIVLIMADDMGYSDIGCYGSEIETPVLDGLANNGVRFSQFYNTSRCCPTRASLLTGLYPHQTGIGWMTQDLGHAAYRGNLNRRCVTFAEVLKSAGYRTYMSGKWHVTKHIGPDSDKSNWPRQRGFDRFYGTIIGAGSFYDPTTLCRDNQFITPENDPGHQEKTFHYTDAISDQAATFIQDHQQQHQDEPFLLYVAYTSAHWPMHAPEKLIAKYQGKYSDGYEPIRKTRQQQAIAKQAIDKRWKLSPTAVDWQSFPHQAWDARCMEVYAAMVDQMDQGIGRIVAALDQANMTDNTIVIYLQDNGGCAEGFGRKSNLDQAQTFPPLGPDGLQKKIWPPMQTRDGRWVRTGPDVMPGAEDTFVAYGKGWANVSNTPFRGYKHDAYEGGISTPMIVHWPDGIAKQNRGKWNHAPSHLIDLMPTMVQAARADYPQEFAGQSIQPMEGISLLDCLGGQTLQREQPIYFAHEGNYALRQGRWKIISPYRKGKPRQWELYDMVEDRTELNNLADTHVELRQQLEVKWQTWADRVGVRPWPVKKKKAKSPSKK